MSGDFINESHRRLNVHTRRMRADGYLVPLRVEHDVVVLPSPIQYARAAHRDATMRIASVRVVWAVRSNFARPEQGLHQLFREILEIVICTLVQQRVWEPNGIRNPLHAQRHPAMVFKIQVIGSNSPLVLKRRVHNIRPEIGACQIATTLRLEHQVIRPPAPLIPDIQAPSLAEARQRNVQFTHKRPAAHHVHCPQKGCRGGHLRHRVT